MEFCIPLDSVSNVLSIGDDVVWLSPLRKLIFAVVSCSLSAEVSFVSVLYCSK